MAQMILVSGVQYERPLTLVELLKKLGCKPAAEIAIFAECREQPTILSEEEIELIEASAAASRGVKVVHYISS